MKRALIALTGAALLLTPLGVAHAQTPQATAITFAKDCGEVTLTLTGPGDGVSGTHGFRWNAVNGDVSTADGLRTDTVTVTDGATETVVIPFSEDEFGGVGAVTVAVIFGPNSHLQPRLDIYPVDTDCEPPTTAPTAPVTTTPAVTTTPDATPLPDLPPLDDGDFDQLGPENVPSGGVATGG